MKIILSASVEPSIATTTPAINNVSATTVTNITILHLGTTLLWKRMRTQVNILAFNKTRKMKICPDSSIKILRRNFSKCRLMTFTKLEGIQVRTSSLQLLTPRHLDLQRKYVFHGTFCRCSEINSPSKQMILVLADNARREITLSVYQQEEYKNFLSDDLKRVNGSCDHKF